MHLGNCVLLNLILWVNPLYAMISNTWNFPGANQLIIYDPKSGRQMNPMQLLPILRGNKRGPLKAAGNVVELPQLWNPCSCEDFVCICCLGLRLGDIFDQRVCTSIGVDISRLAIDLRIVHNGRTIANFDLSAQNPPKYCIPIMVPLPLFTCLRLYNIRAQGANLQVCASLGLTFFSNPLFEVQLDCVRLGANGVQLAKPQQLGAEGLSVEHVGHVGHPGVGGVDGGLVVGFEYEQRQDMRLEENYSGISVEATEPAAEGFFRKGRVRSTTIKSPRG